MYLDPRKSNFRSTLEPFKLPDICCDLNSSAIPILCVHNRVNGFKRSTKYSCKCFEIYVTSYISDDTYDNKLLDVQPDLSCGADSMD